MKEYMIFDTLSFSGILREKRLDSNEEYVSSLKNMMWIHHSPVFL